MSKTSQSQKVRRFKSWQTILFFGILLWLIYGIGSFTLDYYAGGATEPFGVWPEVGGVGMFFIYIFAYYIALVVILPIQVIQRFGVGLAVYLPYAITGLFVDYYFEWAATRSLVSPWAVVGWCVIGLSVGLSADLAWRFLPVGYSQRFRAIATGVVMGVINFLLVTVALRFFYVEYYSGLSSFLGVAYYALPLLIINSGFGGYTAYAISRNI